MTKIYDDNDNGTIAAPETSNDIFVYLLAGDDVFQGNGSPIQHIWGGAGNDTITYTGSDFGVISGDIGGDLLRGGSGLDFISGGFGNDTCEGRDGSDEIYGNHGDDSLFGDIAFTAGADDKLYGGSGNDYLGGLGGNDRMSGDDGDDGYEVSQSGDVVIEGANGGTDTVSAQISYTLGANVENLTLFESAAINGTGNGGANEIIGNAAKNTLSGLGGNDTLGGGDGKDTLRGGAGKDSLTGGPGRDYFVYNSKNDSVKGSNRDVITDLNRAEDDRIDLRPIDADTSANSGNDSFKFIGKASFNGGGGELRYNDNGSTCTVQGDINGDKVADFEIKVNIGSLKSGDFLL